MHRDSGGGAGEAGEVDIQGGAMEISWHGDAPQQGGEQIGEAESVWGHELVVVYQPQR